MKKICCDAVNRGFAAWADGLYMTTLDAPREEIEQFAEIVVDAMLKVHRELGPGLLESAYQACLAHELRCRASRSAVTLRCR
jgi:hypothetical protein